ncbi:tetratricopeptide repeat protein [Leptolyngbya ohadii]|uniref:tetratricopeptide repeat protein n=1 Tax=Leptolyngbya ohadii TaxID=1962290 RepID=UPI000B59E14E|nr:tetratricopeptide repeat protein [Leptolyngbya ohadii]
MLDQIADAFARQDYKTAALLVKQLQQESPDSPWLKLYVGRLQEVSGQFASAEQTYRTLLRNTPSPKIALQARQGLHRLEAQTRRSPDTAQDSAHPSAAQAKEAIQGAGNQTAMGVLVLEPVSPEMRQTAAHKFAQIMGLDTYAARLLLPGRGWRLYRLGTIAELKPIGKQLIAAEIPAFWLPLTAIQRIRVFRVGSLELDDAGATAICYSETNQKGSLRFQWSEVAGRVEGRLPIFERVVDTGVRNQLIRKEQTQDYAQVFDVHLPRRSSILRFADWSYQFDRSFDQGSEVAAPPAMSNRLKWNQLVRSMDDYLSGVPVWGDFPAFGEGALDLMAIVQDLPSHIDLLRTEPSAWDTAFQLYSGLVFEQKSRGEV